MGPVIIGADIGQKHDPTAIAVAEIEWRPIDGRRVDHYIIRHLERLPLGTAYPAVADRLTAVVVNVRAAARAAAGATGGTTGPSTGVFALGFYVDATGVGQPVVDLLAHVGTPVMPVYFTHGDRRLEQDGPPRYISLGKAWLVSRLQALLQTGRILLPKTSEAAALAKELMDYEIKVDQDANDKYGAFKVGTHDDLVTALGLAVQSDPPRTIGPAIGPPRPEMMQDARPIETRGLPPAPYGFDGF